APQAQASPQSPASAALKACSEGICRKGWRRRARDGPGWRRLAYPTAPGCTRPRLRTPAGRGAGLSRRKPYRARLSRVADARLRFCGRSKCLAKGFFLGVVKRRTQHLPANALELLENLVWGNFADQKK